MRNDYESRKFKRELRRRETILFESILQISRNFFFIKFDCLIRFYFVDFDFFFYKSRCWANRNRIWCRNLRLKIANIFENTRRESTQRKVLKTFELNDENFNLNELQNNFEINIFAKTTWIVIDCKICWNKNSLLNVTSAIKIRDVKLFSEKILRLSN